MITDDMLTAVIDAMPDDFDTHDILIELAHHHQHPYIMALHAKIAENVAVPFQALHSSLGTRIRRICEAKGYRFISGGQHVSIDMFRQRSHCAAYRKVG